MSNEQYHIYKLTMRSINYSHEKIYGKGLKDYKQRHEMMLIDAKIAGIKRSVILSTTVNFDSNYYQGLFFYFAWTQQQQ